MDFLVCSFCIKSVVQLKYAEFYLNDYEKLIEIFCAHYSKWMILTGDEAIKGLPFSASEKNDNLRDKMLKSYLDAPVADISPEQKIDTDLDGK